MSDILKSAGAVMPTVTGNIYTAPVSTTIIFLSGGVYNNTASPIELTLSVTKSTGGSITLASALSIAASDSYSFPSKLVLEPSDILSGSCSVTGGNFFSNYVEHSDTAVDVVQAHIDALAADASAIAAAASEAVTTQDAIDTAADVITSAASTASALVSEQAATASATQAETAETAAGISAAAALISEQATTADVLLTNADVVLTHADVVLSHADVVSTSADAATATTKASEASTSAINAATSAISAGSANLRELKIINLGVVSTAQNLDCSLYNYFVLEPTADLTLTFINVTAGSACLLEMEGAGDHAVTLAGVTFVWDTSDTLAPAQATGTDSTILSFISKAGTAFSGKVSYSLV